MLLRRRLPPLVRITVVILSAFTLYSFKHSSRNLRSRRFSRSAGVASKELGDAQNKEFDFSITDFRKVADTCTKTVTNVVFLKTHKTGSSTMSNVMLRFADNHNLNVGLPLKNHWELGGYPAVIDKRLIDPLLSKYNILCHHFRFDINNLRKIMPEDTRYITIIRTPKDNVESVFGFFQDQSPFNDWLKDIKADTTALRLQAFYENPEKFYNKRTDWFFRAKNHMFFDIGYDASSVDESYIDTKVQEMDNIFTLVLLTDFFDESLIIMKHKLCWEWDDIVYIKFKMRIQEAKTKVNKELSEKITKWNRADHKLYNHFNNTFWRTVEEYGKERMSNDLQTFKQKLKDAEQLCVASYQPLKKKSWMVGAKLKPKPSDYCKRLAWSETVYGEKLRDKMYTTIPGLTKPSEAEEQERNKLFNQVATGALQKD